MAASVEQFQTIHTEGAILPPDVLQRIAAGELEGLDPATYHLPTGTKTKEAISQSWTRLLHYWKDFQAARKLILKSDETGGLATREKWLLPLFQELGYGRLTTIKAPEIDGKLFPIERFWQHIPIHLIGCKLQLDHRTKGARGAATAIPHSMVQEFLNRSAEHAWAFLSNGLQLRLLRDSAALSRQSYVEFDLESMMDGEVYSDFAVLWLVCHQSRLEGDKPEDFWLEKWSKLAQEQGTRILEDLRIGVQKAIEALGRGFISHPRNEALIAQLRSGSLTTQDYYRQILRIIYRLLFLFVAEDRGLLHPPAPFDENLRANYLAACDRYDRFYSLRRLRDLAEGYRGSKHGDLWYSLSLLFDALGKPDGCPQLALSAFGSYLWSRVAAADLSGPGQLGTTPGTSPAFIRNEDLLEAVRALSFVERNRVLRAVNYRNLGSVELGSVYESLLELHPQVNIPGRSFALDLAAGNERKTTGSFYTPDSLVQCLLDSALEPVVADAIKGKTSIDAEKALLSLKVCDPAVGSGHFLIAAAHRLARHLARARTGESEPSPQDYQRALRDVIGHCLYGVDLNPMAVELCKISLWMEALEPGKPLSFLEHRIVVGNSLLGSTPALLFRGIPDAAFEPIEGDDKPYCKSFKKQNKDERKGQGMLFVDRPPWEQLGNLAASLSQLDALPDDSVTDIRTKEQRYSDLVESSAYESGRLLADAWCAAFVWKKTGEFDYPITEKIFRDIERNPHSIPPWMKLEIVRLRRQYEFFHWHLAFPSVFTPTAEPEEDDAIGWTGGFDVLLGNPPWERVQLEEKEFFAFVRPEIAVARSRERRQMIAALQRDDPILFGRWQEESRKGLAEVHLVKASDSFRYTGSGNLNTFALFAEKGETVMNSQGRMGMIVPSGLISEVSNKDLFIHWMKDGRLLSAFDFENREGLFPSVDSRFRICLITINGQDGKATAADLAFYLTNTTELSDSARHVQLARGDLVAINPETMTCPQVRSRRDYGLLSSAHAKFGCFVRTDIPTGDPWGAISKQMLNQTHDSDDFLEPSSDIESCIGSDGVARLRDNKFLRVYDGKMIDQFDHRCASVRYEQSSTFRTTASQATTTEQHRNPRFLTQPQYWIPQSRVQRVVPEKLLQRGWVLAFREVTASTNWRTVIASVVPLCGLMNSVPYLFTERDADEQAVLLGALNSFALDYVARQKIGGTHLSHFQLRQLPLPSPTHIRQMGTRCAVGLAMEQVTARVMELTYTSWDLLPFAKDCGYDGPPFLWDEGRRFELRCELDAAFFHLYGIIRDDVDYIMNTFPIVKRKDEQNFNGEFRTKGAILEIYDAMAEATRIGKAYRTRLDPPPADPRVAHPRGPSGIRARTNVPTLVACELVVLMLDQWKKPVQRMVADRGLILALNDQARAQVLSSSAQTQSLSASVIQTAPTVNFDIVWKTLKATNFVTLQDNGNSVVVSRIAGTPLQATDPANVARAKEAIKAFELIEKQRAAWPTEVDDVEYAFS